MVHNCTGQADRMALIKSPGVEHRGGFCELMSAIMMLSKLGLTLLAEALAAHAEQPKQSGSHQQDGRRLGHWGGATA